jgi:hypothetical protein
MTGLYRNQGTGRTTMVRRGRRGKEMVDIGLCEHCQGQGMLTYAGEDQIMYTDCNLCGGIGRKLASSKVQTDAIHAMEMAVEALELHVRRLKEQLQALKYQGE